MNEKNGSPKPTPPAPWDVYWNYQLGIAETPQGRKIVLTASAEGVASSSMWFTPDSWGEFVEQAQVIHTQARSGLIIAKDVPRGN